MQGVVFNVHNNNGVYSVSSGTDFAGRWDKCVAGGKWPPNKEAPRDLQELCTCL